MGTTLIQKDALIQSHYLPTLLGQLVVAFDENFYEISHVIFWCSLSSASERLKTTTGKLDENLGTILQHLENIDIKQQEISNNINTGLSKTE